ncbi:MAG: DUF4164 family protein [Beijerinckiaceae bacterium]
MTDGNNLIAAEALKRLSVAVDLLEAAATRRLAAERADADRLTELDLMRADRVRLAEQLDAAMARNAAYDQALPDMERKVERAMELMGDALAREA